MSNWSHHESLHVSVKHSRLSSSDVLAEETNERMVEFAEGGVCNCWLDKLNKSYIVENDRVELTVKCPSRKYQQPWEDSCGA